VYDCYTGNKINQSRLFFIKNLNTFKAAWTTISEDKFNIEGMEWTSVNEYMSQNELFVDKIFDDKRFVLKRVLRVRIPIPSMDGHDVLWQHSRNNDSVYQKGPQIAFMGRKRIMPIEAI
jgi:predicted NAD-dependent protein-ADP-ribosyltransferase YbiA (DUF1768 family)